MRVLKVGYKTDILSLNMRQLEKELEELNCKKFRAKQIYQWLHVKLVNSFDEMTNLPCDLRVALKNKYDISPLTLVKKLESKEDGTVKFLFKLRDGNVIESVLMTYEHGNSVCISSQVGCMMGCKFCASAIGGLIRNLTVSEMLSQVYYIKKVSGKRVSNVVVMGTGEPLDNYPNFLSFVKMITDESGLNISQRNLTVSTCGIIPSIIELAKEKLQITLALSLHGATQEKRESLMPIAKRYPLEELLFACDYYYNKTKRRITFEYNIIAGVNDTDEDANELAKLLADWNCHLNLIPYNTVDIYSFRRPEQKSVNIFKNKLEKNGINVTIRREMGTDIDGACGQLRRGSLE